MVKGYSIDPAIDQRHIDQMIRVLKSKVKVIRGWVPYLGGYSQDWKTEQPIVYIDSRLPDVLKVGRRWMHPARYILIHEIIEKSLLDSFQLHYPLAHSAATAAERTAVIADNYDWNTYTEILKPYISLARERPTPTATPPVDLDQQAYRDSGELWLLDQAA